MTAPPGDAAAERIARLQALSARENVMALAHVAAAYPGVADAALEFCDDLLISDLGEAIRKRLDDPAGLLHDLADVSGGGVPYPPGDDETPERLAATRARAARSNAGLAPGTESVSGRSEPRPQPPAGPCDLRFRPVVRYAVDDDPSSATGLLRITCQGHPGYAMGLADEHSLEFLTRIAVQHEGGAS